MGIQHDTEEESTDEDYSEDYDQSEYMDYYNRYIDEVNQNSEETNAPQTAIYIIATTPDDNQILQLSEFRDAEVVSQQRNSQGDEFQESIEGGKIPT